MNLVGQRNYYEKGVGPSGIGRGGKMTAGSKGILTSANRAVPLGLAPYLRIETDSLRMELNVIGIVVRWLG